MLLSSLGLILPLLISPTIMKSNDDPSGGYSTNVVSFSSSYSFYNSLYETYFYFEDFRNNQLGYTFNTDIYFDYNGSSTLLYSVEFGNYNTDWGKFDITIEQNHDFPMNECNFTCFLLVGFKLAGVEKFVLSSPIFQDSEFAFDYGSKYFTRLYGVDDVNRSGTNYCTQVSGNTYDLPNNADYDSVYIDVIWQWSPYNSVTSDDVGTAYNEGYQNGWSVGQQVGYQQGYENSERYTEGYAEGYDIGRSNGYSEGYAVGIHESGSFNFGSILKAVVDTPIYFLQSLFGWSLFGEGETMATIIITLITALVFVALLKKVF